VLKLASPSAVAMRLPKVFCQMFDFATAPPGIVTDTCASGTVEGVPAPLEPWLCTALKVYIDTALKLAGARRVDTTVRGRPIGERARVPLLRLDVEIDWI
jgi:hypothetical protein